jgi:hypothetical protein
MGVLMQQSLDDGESGIMKWSIPALDHQKIYPDFDTVATLEDSQYNREWAVMKERVDKEHAKFEAKVQRVRDGEFRHFRYHLK